MINKILTILLFITKVSLFIGIALLVLMLDKGFLGITSSMILIADLTDIILYLVGFGIFVATIFLFPILILVFLMFLISKIFKLGWTEKYTPLNKLVKLLFVSVLFGMITSFVALDFGKRSKIVVINATFSTITNISVIGYGSINSHDIENLSPGTAKSYHHYGEEWEMGDKYEINYDKNGSEKTTYKKTNLGKSIFFLY